MSLFIPIARATLLIPTDYNNHLFILLTGPKQPEGYTCNNNLLVPIGTVYPERPYDATCLLYVGDHPFIRHDSYVNYRMSRIEATDKIDTMVRNGAFSQRDNLDGAIFARVCRGLLESRHTALKIRNFYEA